MQSLLRKCVDAFAGAVVRRLGKAARWLARRESLVARDLRQSAPVLSVVTIAACCAAALAVASNADRVTVARAGQRTAAPVDSSGLGTRGPGPTAPAGAEAVTHLFSADSRTYKTAEGPYTTIFYGHQVNTLQANGTWTPMSEPAIATAMRRHRRARRPKTASETLKVSKDCPLESASPTTSFCTSATDYVGYDGTNTDNTLISFNVKETIPTDANVLNAQLGLYLYESSTTTGVAVSAHALLKPWSTSATWNTYNGSSAWEQAGAEKGSEKTSEADYTTTNGVENSSVTKPAGWAHWYPTQIVQEWVTEKLANNGLVLGDSNQKHTTNLLDFRSSKATEDTPYLTIAWQPRGQEDPPFYSLQSLSLGYRQTLKVNLASGDLFLNSTDLAVKGVGVPFLAEHNYDSLDDEGGSVNPFYSLPGAHVYADGSVSVGINRYDFEPYILQSNGAFKTPPGMSNATLCKVGETIGGKECKGNSIDGSKAVYALTFNEAGNSPLYAQGNKIDFGENGGVWSIADRYGNALAFNYEGGLKVKDTQGRTFTRRTTEVKGFPVTSSWVESGGGTREVKYTYNSDGQLETYTTAEGNKINYAYDANGNLKEYTDPKGNVTKFSYKSGTHQIEKIELPEVGGKHPIWEYHYYTAAEKHGHECENAGTEGITKKTIVKDPDEHESTFCANALDEVLQSFDAKGNKTAAAFDSLGHTIATTESSPGGEEKGDIESSVYEAEGGSGAVGQLLCSITGIAVQQKKCPSSEPNKEMLGTLFKYADKTNEYLPTTETGPQGAAVEYCYNDGNEAGCPEKTTGPAGSLQRIKDGLSSENEFKFAYDTKGELTEATDALGHTTTYEYDEKGNLKTVTPPAAPEEEQIKPTKITVDAESRPHVIEDGEGHVETIAYDANDHITEIAFSGTGTSKTVKFEYDEDGNLIKREDPTGTTKYTVDALNRVTKESLPGSLSNEYAYDPASNLESFTDGGGTTKYKYNSLNLVESMTEPGEKTTSFTYDGDHRLTKVEYASKAAESFELDINGRPKAIAFSGLSGTSVPNLAYTYENEGDQTELISSLSESTGPTTEYSYDALNRLKRALRKVSGSTGQRYEYILDGDGNRKQQNVNLSSWEEKEHAGEEVTYYNTNADNLLECRQTVEVKEGKCSGSSSTELSHYKYDKAGEELAITPKLEASGSTFAYNAAKETNSITPSGESEQPLSYGGTGQGDLVELGTTKLQNSLLGLTREAASSGTSYFAYTPDGLMVDQRTPSGNFNPLFDAQGDVIALVNSSGKVERTFQYGPYGENVESGGEQKVPFHFGFQGGYRMPGGNAGKGKEGKENKVPNGLYHFGARYYDPTVGRWTQTDPLGGGFAFVGDDPINRTDPEGLRILGYAENGFCSASWRYYLYQKRRSRYWREVLNGCLKLEREDEVFAEQHVGLDEAEALTGRR